MKRKWKDEEVDYLENNYKKLNKQIATYLNRSVNSIVNKKIKLNLRYKLREKLIFNKEQEQILLGSLLGDGCISRGKYSYQYKEGHSLKQEGYLLWKNNYLNFNTYSLGKIPTIYKSNNGLKEYYNLFYPNGKKIVTREILDKLEPLGLAVWYMDDGCYNYKSKAMSLATHSFKLEGNILIKQWFKEKYDFDFRINKYKPHKHNLDGRTIINKSSFNIELNSLDTKKFIEIIKLYILQIPSMFYKIGLDKNRADLVRIKRNSYQKKRYKNNPIAINEYNKKWYLKNREKRLKSIEKWRLDNPEKVKLYLKRHYLKKEIIYDN